MFGVSVVLVALIAGGGVWLRSALYFDVKPNTIASGGTVVRGGDKGVMVLSGDSQAAMYGTEIASIARARGLTLYALGTAGRNQLPNEEGTSWPAVATLVAQKKLKLILVDYEPPPVPLSIVYPHAKLLSARVRIFAEWATRNLRAEFDYKAAGA